MRFLLRYILTLFFILSFQNEGKLKAANCLDSNLDSLVYLTNHFEHMMASQTEKWYKCCHSDVFSILNRLSMKEEEKIEIVLPNVQELGDFSHIIVCDSSSNRDLNYIKHVKLKEFSVLSCWQWILLYKINYFLPTFGHGSYQRRTIVLTDEKRKNVISQYVSTIPDSIWQTMDVEGGTIPESQRDQMLRKKIVPFQIQFIKSKQIVNIEFCSWNNWSGLTKHSITLHIKTDLSVEIINQHSEIIIPYNCGVLL